MSVILHTFASSYLSSFSYYCIHRAREHTISAFSRYVWHTVSSLHLCTTAHLHQPLLRLRTYVRTVQDVIYPLQVCACRCIVGVSLCAAIRVRRGTRSRMGLAKGGRYLVGGREIRAGHEPLPEACVHTDRAAHTEKDRERVRGKG